MSGGGLRAGRAAELSPRARRWSSTSPSWSPGRRRPPTLRALLQQRTRWSQGYLQTLAKGDWRRLPRRQRALGAYILAMPYLMALAWLMIPVAIATALALKAPVPITLISFLPALPILSILVMELAGLGQFCRLYGERARARDYARLVVGLPLYQAVLAFASARAVVREARGVRGWEKTVHHGLHLVSHSDGTDRGGLRAIRDPSRRRRRLCGLGSPEPPTGFDAAAPREAPSQARRWWLTRRPTPDRRRQRQWAFRALRSTPRDQRRWPAVDEARGRLGERVRLPLAADRLAGQLCARSSRPASRRARSHGKADQVPRRPRGVAPAAPGRGARPDDEHPPLARNLVRRGHLRRQRVGGTGARSARLLHLHLWSPAAGLADDLHLDLGGGIFGHTTYSVGGGREFISAVIVVSCALVYSLARRIGIDRPFAVGAVILFALCPLGLHFHRGVLLDNPAVAWALAAFVLALTPERRLWAFAASGACFALSVLSKETTLVLLPALILAAAQHSDYRTRRYCLTLLGSFLALIGLAYPLYAALKGELIPGSGHVSLVGSVIDMLFTRQGTGSVFDPHSVAHGTVMDWLRLDPWLLGAALLLSPIALARRNTRAIALAFLIQVAVILRPGYLPNMYVIALLPFAALIVAGTVQSWWRVADGRLRSPPADRGASAASGAPALLLRWGAVTTSGVALAVVAVIAALVVAPRWARTDHEALTARQDGPQRAAEEWLVANVGRGQPIIVTDDFWIYLIEHGFDSRTAEGGLNSRTVVSYWPLDYDPAVKRLFPNGWRDFDFVVSTGAMRVTATYTPNTAQALQHSRVVARFGSGGGRIEVRAIMPADRSS